MAQSTSEHEARYEARREAAPVAICSSAVLTVLALVSWRAGWDVVGFPWWTWLILAIPGLVLSVDLWIGPGGVGIASRTRWAGVLLGLIVLGNVAGVALLISALVSTRSSDISGGQLLMTAVVIWIANVIAFGVWYWEVDDGGPFERANKERKTPDFQFPQDENPGLARSGWSPRIWDYMYISLTAGSAFSPTDAMPLTHKAKLLLGIESTVSLLLIVLLTARAVNVLGS